jgi:proteic killer suppression protein
MILSFLDKEAEKIWQGQRSKRLPHDIQDRALRKLRQLSVSTNLDDLKNPPGNHLEALHGDRSDQYSIRINQQWRICFLWYEGHAFDVEIVDYH